MTTAQAAVGSGDWATAKNHAEQALALMVALPNGEKDRNVLEWHPEAIQKFIQHCDSRQAEASRATSGNSLFGSQKFKYVRPTP